MLSIPKKDGRRMKPQDVSLPNFIKMAPVTFDIEDCSIAYMLNAKLTNGGTIKWSLRARNDHCSLLISFVNPRAQDEKQHGRRRRQTAGEHTQCVSQPATDTRQQVSSSPTTSPTTSKPPAKRVRANTPTSDQQQQADTHQQGIENPLFPNTVQATFSPGPYSGDSNLEQDVESDSDSDIADADTCNNSNNSSKASSPPQSPTKNPTATSTTRSTPKQPDKRIRIPTRSEEKNITCNEKITTNMYKWTDEQGRHQYWMKTADQSIVLFHNLQNNPRVKIQLHTWDNVPRYVTQNTTSIINNNNAEPIDRYYHQMFRQCLNMKLEHGVECTWAYCINTDQQMLKTSTT